MLFDFERDGWHFGLLGDDGVAHRVAAKDVVEHGYLYHVVMSATLSGL